MVQYLNIFSKQHHILFKFVEKLLEILFSYLQVVLNYSYVDCLRFFLLLNPYHSERCIFVPLSLKIERGL